MDGAAALDDRAREGGEVFQRMHPALAGEAQARSAVEAVDWGARQPLDAGEADLMRGIALLIEQRRRIARREEEIAVDALEVAADRGLTLDRLDAIDRGGVARGGETRIVDAAQPDQFAPAVVERVREMRRG